MTLRLNFRAAVGAAVLGRRPAAWAAVWALLAALAIPVGCRPGHRDADPVVLVDLDGRDVSVTSDAAIRVWVYVFLGVECPISNRFLPELAALEKEHAPRGVRFVPVYPNADETPDRIRRHRAEFGLAPAAYRDPQHRVAERLRAHRTPEVVVITREFGQVYQGRVNDQYAALGVGKPLPTRHDLAEVLQALARGERVSPRIQAAVGCSFRALP